tara:strand:+ start:1314 stop:1604 length:291 start_codon:yes stop_codon:yes gene_type:complete
MIRLLFKKQKPLLLGRWGYSMTQKNIDFANTDHCGTCNLNSIEQHFTVKGNDVKEIANKINKENEEWKKNRKKFYRVDDDIIDINFMKRDNTWSGI